MTPFVGLKLGRYTLEALIGTGGMARVYRAADDVSGRRCAIKILRFSGKKLTARLLREGQLQSQLSHPNILPVLGFVDALGSPGIVIELIEGPDLQAVLSRGPLLPAQIDALVRGLLSGVAAAHDAGLVHRDLKPSNVMLSPSAAGPIPKVTDFGLVKALNEEDGAEPVTRTGATLGTPGFMAPEQLRDARHVDARADVFSLGALIYALATGEPPFTQRDLGALLGATESERYPSLAERAPQLGARRLEIVKRALRGDPAARFADAGEMLAAWQQEPPLVADWGALLPSSGDPASTHETLLTTANDQTWDLQTADSWREERVLLCTHESTEDQRQRLLRWRGVCIQSTPALYLFHSTEDAVGFLGAAPSRSVLHRGEVTLRENNLGAVALGAQRLEAFGEDVALVQALLGAVPPGRILATRAAFPDPRPGLRSRGWWRRPGADALFELVELNGSAEALPDTASAWRVVRDGDTWRRRSERPSTLPPSDSAMIGREPELHALSAAVQASRCVAIVGAPGVGKSRLALAIGQLSRAHFPGGIGWVSLAGVRTAAALAAATRDALQQLGNGRRLLILDGFDELALQQREIPAAASVNVLVTSRVRPAVDDDSLFRLGPLDTSSARTLFESHAQDHRPGFTLGAANQDHVDAITRAVGLVPAAIVRVAARVRMMPPAKLSARLGNRSRLLSAPRGPSLVDEIDESLSRLPDGARSALAALAASAGEPTAEQLSAEALRVLVDHSLLFPLDDGRLALDPTIRERALRRQ